MTDRRSFATSHSHESAQSSDPNVFSDDYALEDYDGRGRDAETLLGRENSVAQGSHPPRSQSIQLTYDSDLPSVRRSRLSMLSTRSNRRRSTSSREGENSLTRTGSFAHQSVRSLSSVVPPRAQSPYQGATGPSHPYGMYTQDISVTRTASAATSSTFRRPERAYSGPGGPTQPYGMYTQNTVPEDGDSVGGFGSSIAPGFTSLGQGYRRRLGPDGEDADDLIGPDGYTEQLPPYTRYADGVTPKVDLEEPPPEAGLLPPQQTQEHAPGQAHFLPAENYRPPDVQSPVPSNPFDDRSAQSTSTTAVDSADGSEKGRWKDRMKKKSTRPVCAGLMPCWLLICIVFAFCLAILLGGVIGGIVAHHGAIPKPTPLPTYPASVTQEAAAAPTLSPTQTGDAEAMSTATTGLPPLPTGNFVFTLPNASITSTSCLSYQTQEDTWGCATGVTLNITIVVGDSNSPTINMNVPNPDQQPLRYGAQPPLLTGPSTLSLRKDKTQWRRGPAYWFSSAAYNKLVILREEEFSGDPPTVKRSILEARSSAWWKNEPVKPRDRPWFCYWNNTYLEGFIYLTADEAGSGGTSPSTPLVTDSAAATQTPAAITPSSPPRYPKVMRVRELRNASNNKESLPPYCQQLEILPSAQPGPQCGASVALQENGAMTQTSSQTVTATDAAAPSTSIAPAAVSPQLVPRQAPMIGGACMCDWTN